MAVAAQLDLQALKVSCWLFDLLESGAPPEGVASL